MALPASGRVPSMAMAIAVSISMAHKVVVSVRVRQAVVEVCFGRAFPEIWR